METIRKSVTIFPILLLFFHLLPSCHPPEPSGTPELYPVVKVVDGDTFWVDDGSEKGLKVRLIGVDAPETRKSSRKETGYFGIESKDYLTELLLGNEVRLEHDVDRRDKYGRTLAYVYLEDGTFVNAELLRNGFAMVMTVPPNVRFAEEFLELQKDARDGHRGLWRSD